MNTRSAARLWHAATAAIAAFGLLAQLVLVSIGVPLVWLGYTMIVGATTVWYPYPFLDVGADGVVAVALAALGVTVLIFAVSNLYWLGVRRLPSSRVLVTDAA